MKSRFATRRSRMLAIVVAAAAFVACADRGSDGASTLLPGPATSASSAPAPDTFRVAFETSKGRFVVEARRDWAPRGVDRFHALVKQQYFDDVRFYRVLPGFMAQFGMHGDAKVTEAWDKLEIEDDSVKQSNRRGTVTFATSGPNTRTTQLFINYVDNANLDGMGFSPIGEVVEGMAVVDSLNGEYGEGAPYGSGPDQMRIGAEGNAYLMREFPKLDFIRTARLIER